MFGCPQVSEHDAIVTGQMAVGLRQESKCSPKIVSKSRLVAGKRSPVSNPRSSSGGNLTSNPGTRQKLANKGMQDNSNGQPGKQMGAGNQSSLGACGQTRSPETDGISLELEKAH